MNPKRLGFKVIRIHMGTFDYTVECIVGPAKNVVRYVSWKHDCESEAPHEVALGICYWRKGYVPVIWLPRAPRSPKEIGTLAHEALHAIRHMLEDWAGMPMTFETQEAFCHATGYLVKGILEGLRK